MMNWCSCEDIRNLNVNRDTAIKEELTSEFIGLLEKIQSEKQNNEDQKPVSTKTSDTRPSSGKNYHGEDDRDHDENGRNKPSVLEEERTSKSNEDNNDEAKDEEVGGEVGAESADNNDEAEHEAETIDEVELESEDVDVDVDVAENETNEVYHSSGESKPNLPSKGICEICLERDPNTSKEAHHTGRHVRKR
uniref:Uncharacterized protein n=1 Tax=Aplanochytrium stocchinoi TaxID=215587 RepID=A0A7S3PHY8_9STRA|mmetsp:Transcript_17402/g.21425  ORF Transcript_17402/g.21425 Transcript_17402/m.21425 type:complete len:192 (-) Transcript_17402:209-784(-)